MAGAPFKGKQAEVNGFTVRVAPEKHRTTGKTPRRGVTVLRGSRRVGSAFLYGEELHIQSLGGLSKRGLLEALAECGAIAAPKPKPAPEAPKPSRAPKASASR